MKRKRCKNYSECKGWQRYPTFKLCSNRYVKLKGYNTAKYKNDKLNKNTELPKP